MDKIDRLFDAMEHPERFTSTDIETMLQDPEMKEVLDLLDKTKSSLQPIPTPDVENEWEKFKNTHSKPGKAHRFRLTNFFFRKIVASLAIFIVSLTAVAAFVGIGVKYFNRQNLDQVITMRNSETHVAVPQPDSVMNIDEAEMVSTKTVVFDNETFETIVTKIAEHYRYTVVFNSDNSKALRLYYRWNPVLPIEEIVESLNNFEHINLTIKDKTLNVD